MLNEVKAAKETILIRPHNRHLEALLRRCRERKIALNRDKLKLKRKEVLFMGHALTPHGVKIDPEKGKAE